MTSAPSRNVLTLLAPGAEEIEFITIPDLLVRAGHRVTIAALTDIPLVRGSRGLPLAAHTTLDRLAPQEWDLIYLPGGMGSATACRDDARVQELAERQLANHRLLAVICACPIALIPRNLARGRKLTSFPGVRSDLEAHGAIWIDAPVIQDRSLVTSQSAGTAMALGLTLVGLLSGPGQAQAVANAILSPLPVPLP